MEITNNLLAALVLLAMVFSIFGTFSMLALVPKGPVSITGMQTTEAQGTAQVEIESEVGISLEVSTVDFNTIDNTPNTQNDTTNYSPHPFVLRNNGSVTVNVSIAESTGNTLWVNDTEESMFQFNVTANTTVCSQCIYMTSTWTDFSEANLAENASASDIDMGSGGTCHSNLVYNLTSTTGRDVNVDLRITVPDAEVAGLKSGTIFFRARDAGACP